MRRLSKDKRLNDVLLFGQMLLSECTSGNLGQKLDVKSEIPFVERLKLFTALQDSVLLAHKVEPRKDTNGLSELREALNDGKQDTDGDDRPANGSPAAAIFAATEESDETTTVQ